MNFEKKILKTVFYENEIQKLEKNQPQLYSKIIRMINKSRTIYLDEIINHIERICLPNTSQLQELKKIISSKSIARNAAK